MAQNIEVEIRSFISGDKYKELLDFFAKNGETVSEDSQETFYFDAPVDLRIQRNNFYSKIWLKKGKIHDEQREEIEIKFAREDFESLEKLFLTLGYQVQIKWFRTRNHYRWQGIDVMVDFTKGYGYILELEILTDEAGKEDALNNLKNKMKDLGIDITPKEEFDSKYAYYKENWKSLIDGSWPACIATRSVAGR